MNSAPDPPRRQIPASPFADDDGSASTELVAALSHFSDGEGDATAVMTALARSRLLVPVVAMLESQDVDADGNTVEKDSSMATALVQGPRGERAMLAFTSVESLLCWRVAARPAPLSGIAAAQAAIAEEAETLLVDIGGPIPFAVGGGDLRVLARSTDETRLRRRLAELLEGTAHLTAAYFSFGDEGALLTLIVDPTLSDADYQAVLDAVSERLAKDALVSQGLSPGLTLRVLSEDHDPPDGSSKVAGAP